MNDIPWAGLEALAAVVRAGSFRAASAELSVSPSALSHRIRNLESQLGLRVLNRTTRSHGLTPAGERLLFRFGPIREDLSTTLEGLQADAEQVRGVLRVNAPPLASRHTLPPLLARLGARHPDVQVEVVSETALVDIVSAGFDAGVRFPSQLPADMIARELGTPMRFVVVGSPAYLEASGIPEHPHDLHRHRCVALQFPSGRRFAWEFFRGRDALVVKVPATVVVGESLEGVGLARAGVGLAYCAEADVRDDLAYGRLTTVLDAWRPAEERFRLYYPSRRWQRTPLSALLKLVESSEV